MCNPAATTGHRQCWWHQLCIGTYHHWRSSWEADAEREAIGYPTELAEYSERNPPPTFKATITGLAGSSG